MIERRPDSEDRRLIRVNLTAGGRSFLDKILPGYTQWLTSIVEPLNGEERELLVDLLEKIRIRIGQSTAIRTITNS